MLSERNNAFPAPSGTRFSMWQFIDCENLLFQGSGLIDGQGFMWWMREYVGENFDGRPDLVDMTRGRNIEWTGIKVQNSP